MRITLDRAVYLPGSQVACAVENPPSDMANLRFRLLHLKDTVLEETIDPGSTDITFALPEDDLPVICWSPKDWIRTGKSLQLP